jgi:hypothetical protein
VFAEELLEFSALYLITDELLFDAQLILLEINAGDSSKVALLRFFPCLLQHLKSFLRFFVE